MHSHNGSSGWWQLGHVFELPGALRSCLQLPVFTSWIASANISMFDERLPATILGSRFLILRSPSMADTIWRTSSTALASAWGRHLWYGAARRRRQLMTMHFRADDILHPAFLRGGLAWRCWATSSTILALASRRRIEILRLLPYNPS